MAETPAAPAAPKAPAKRSKSKSPAAWAKLVRADLQQAVEGVIKAGQHLMEAKEDVGHGNFEAWLKEEVKISISAAERLMAIARHPALSNSQHVAILPTSWGTLGELARIPPPALTKAIEDGAVFPEMERKDAQKLVRLVQNEQTGAPVSNRSSASTVSPTAPIVRFWEHLLGVREHIAGLRELNPEKLVETAVDLDAMRSDLEQASDELAESQTLLDELRKLL